MSGQGKIIDTESDVGKHTVICSCEECIRIKKAIFGSENIEKLLRLKIDPLVKQILINDGIWQPDPEN